MLFFTGQFRDSSGSNDGETVPSHHRRTGLDLLLPLEAAWHQPKSESATKTGTTAGDWLDGAGMDMVAEHGGQPTPIFTSKAVSNDAKMAAVLLCDVLGALCILLNAFVIVALIRNRRRVLVNVFYVLVLHCAIVDLIRGGCLIAWGMPHLLIHTMRSLEDRLMALKINQFTLVILRSCNLLTIFNLLVFTTNEFIVIKYPLHYRRYFRRRTVLLILAFCWLVSLLFGVGSVFSNFFESAHSVMVPSKWAIEQNNVSAASFFLRAMDTAEGGAADHFGPWPSEDEDNQLGVAVAEQIGGDPAASGQQQLFGLAGSSGVTRRQLAGLSVNVLSMLMIFVLCYVCLFTVLICYGKILRTIRQFQKCGSESGGPRRVLGQQQHQQSTITHEDQKRLGRTGSIYHKRSVHQQRTHQQTQGTPPNVAMRGLAQQRQSSVCSGGVPTGGSLHNKKVSIPGSPQSGQSGNMSGDQPQQQQPSGSCGRCPGCAANAAAEDQLHKSRRCNSHRKWRSHLMSRHKYLIVIGTVLFVDVLFLFPYSGIQMVALLHLNNLLATSQMTTLIRWGLQILIGVHSVCQPLCYFRMTEFRRLACCLGGSRRFAGSGSSAGSVFAPGASRSAKSVGSKSFGLTRDDECASVIAQKKSIVLSTLISDGSPRAGDEPANGRADRTNWVNPSVGERQMLLIAQRRKWTRNLSLLCKEEGEELELFLSRAYKRRDDGQMEGGGHEKRRKKPSRRRPMHKGGSLKDRSLDLEEEDEGRGEEDKKKKAGGSDGKLLEAKMSQKIREYDEEEKEDEEGEEEEGDVDDNVMEEEAKKEEQMKEIIIKDGKKNETRGNDQTSDQHPSQNRPYQDERNIQDAEAGMTTRLLATQEEEELVEDGKERLEMDSIKETKRGLIRNILGRIGQMMGRSRKTAADGCDEEEEPTLLDSDWKRPGEVLQFRTYGPDTELRPKISDLSGLRSNSVFTPLNLSTNPSRQPSTQWSRRPTWNKK